MDQNAAELNHLISLLWSFALTGLLISAIIVIIIYLVNKKIYLMSEYFAQTKSPYLSVRFDKGKLGEYYTYKYLRPLKGCRKYLFNCYIPKGDGTTTEIDVIMLHETGVYVFESKNYSGWIFGSENQQTWTQTLPTGKGRSQKSRFLNPIIQNKVHIKWLQEYLGEETRLPVYSYIVFSDRCTLKSITLTSGNHHIINRYNILSAVTANAASVGSVLSEEQINELYDKLHPLTQADESVKIAHVDNIAQKHFTNKSVPSIGPIPSIPTERICPRCGSKMILRTASKGANAGKQFWGCERFPKCRYIENIK